MDWQLVASYFTVKSTDIIAVCEKLLPISDIFVFDFERVLADRLKLHAPTCKTKQNKTKQTKRFNKLQFPNF